MFIIIQVGFLLCFHRVRVVCRCDSGQRGMEVLDGFGSVEKNIIVNADMCWEPVDLLGNRCDVTDG